MTGNFLANFFVASVVVTDETDISDGVCCGLLWSHGSEIAHNRVHEVEHTLGFLEALVQLGHFLRGWLVLEARTEIGGNPIRHKLLEVALHGLVGLEGGPHLFGDASDLVEVG